MNSSHVFPKSNALTFHDCALPLVFRSVELLPSGNLRLYQVGANDAASYTCRAHNPAGEAVRRALLTVRTPPTARVRPQNGQCAHGAGQWWSAGPGSGLSAIENVQWSRWAMDRLIVMCTV